MKRQFLQLPPHYLPTTVSKIMYGRVQCGICGKKRNASCYRLMKVLGWVTRVVTNALGKNVCVTRCKKHSGDKFAYYNVIQEKK